MSTALKTLVPETFGTSLDLSRPELLRALMERYTPRRPQTPSLVPRPPTALIVSAPDDPATKLREALEDQGWGVRTCGGPANVGCPLMRAKSCELRTSADAVVVFVGSSGTSRPSRDLVRLRCAADSSSPGVVALEANLAPPRYSGHTALVGAMRGPEAILEAIHGIDAKLDPE